MYNKLNANHYHLVYYIFSVGLVGERGSVAGVLRVIQVTVLSLGIHAWVWYVVQPSVQPEPNRGMASAAIRLNAVQWVAASPEPIQHKTGLKHEEKSPQLTPVKAVQQSQPVHKKARRLPTKKPPHRVKKAQMVKPHKTVTTPTPSVTPDHKPHESSASAAQQVGIADKPPMLEKPIFRIPPNKPHYPPSARRHNMQGVVTVEATLNAQGDVVQVEVLQSSGFALLDAAAVDAVRTWHFRPLKRQGKAQASRVVAPVAFRLR